MNKHIFILLFLIITLALGGAYACIQIKRNRVLKEIKHAGFELVNRELRAPFILFVPGFLSRRVSDDDYSDILRNVFPKSEVEIAKWESGLSASDWDVAIDNAELFAEELFEKIEKKDVSERENLVLIGHSLGGRIVIRTLAKLANQNKKIRRGVFLGAAIPDDDNDISLAIRATIFPCINIFSRDDYVLRNVYGTVGEKNTEAYMKCALGAYGSRLRHPNLAMLEFSIKGENEDEIQDEKYNNHSARQYILELGEHLNDNSIISALFPPMSPRRLSLEKDSWKEVDQIEGWTLYKHILTNQYKIVSPWGNVSVLADEEKALMEYERLKANLLQTQKYNSRTINVENEDTPLMKVIPTPVIVAWKTEEECNDWLLQRNVFGTYRIVDAHDFQRSHGKEAQMKRVFENIKAQFQE